MEPVAEVEPQAQAASRVDNFAERLPRWRSARDLHTVQYCLWRRRAYIHSGRLMAHRKACERALEDAGQLASKEMWEAMALLGKNAGFNVFLGSAEVPERVKRVVKHLIICMANVVGSNAHRTF